MSEHTPLTKTELSDLAAAYGWWRAHGDPEMFYDALNDALAARTSTATADTGCRPGCKPGGECRWVGCKNAATADTGLRERVEAVLPDQCYVLRSEASAGPTCLDLIGGGFENGAKWTEELCCLPCRIRAALDATPASTEDRDLYDVALKVTDEVLGKGTYARINKENPDPGVQAAIRRAES